MKPLALLAIGLGAVAGALLLSKDQIMPPTPGVGFPTSQEPIDARPDREDVVAFTASDRIHGPRPGVESFRGFVLGLLGGDDLGIWSSLQHRQVNSHSEHDVGHAWDWGFKTKDDAEVFIQWLRANNDEWARRFGIGYLIFDHRMLRIYEPVGWTPYGGADSHTTHVHFSFSRDGALGKTSGYSFYQDNRAIV